MNIDFFILVIIYLAVILGIHYKLKSPSKKTKQAILKNIDKVIQDIPDDLHSESEITSVEEPKDIEEETMIIDSNELENIKDDISTDFLKYLKVEENDNNETYRKLSDSMDINLTENVKSLDSFFTENNEKYTFDEVPTIDKNKNKLIGNVKNLNSEKIFDQVYAFDEFNDNFALI